ncbi:MAG TPA: ribonuclease HII [Actinomycetes bacterium]|nr:ribonuclease HII [Actinomycetes bacterium]
MAATTARARRSTVPTLRVERALLRERGMRLAAVDEVGRGALAGPVSVGVVLVDLAVSTAPKGLRDSKLLTPEARTTLAPRLRRWAPAHAVGHASAREIDTIGILRALRLAGERAFAQLPEEPDVVLLDGSYDWLTRPGSGEQPTLFDDPAILEAPPGPERDVRTLVKADLRCAGVAAASVLAKTERDALMVSLASRFPAYGWEVNKGYATPDHRAALREHGASEEHRRSWNLWGEDRDDLGEEEDREPDDGMLDEGEQEEDRW